MVKLNNADIVLLSKPRRVSTGLIRNLCYETCHTKQARRKLTVVLLQCNLCWKTLIKNLPSLVNTYKVICVALGYGCGGVASGKFFSSQSFSCI